MIVKRSQDLGLGILAGTGSNTIQYWSTWSWSHLMISLKGYADDDPYVHWVQQTTHTRWGTNTWGEKLAPYPTDHLEYRYRQTVNEIQEVLERHGRRHPLDV